MDRGNENDSILPFEELIDIETSGFKVDYLPSVYSLSVNIIEEHNEEEYITDVAAPMLDHDPRAKPTLFVQIITEQVVKCRKKLLHTQHFRALASLIQAFAVVSACIDNYSCFEKFVDDLEDKGDYSDRPSSYVMWAFASVADNNIDKSSCDKVVLRSMLDLLAQDVDDHISSQFGQS